VHGVQNLGVPPPGVRSSAGVQPHPSQLPPPSMPPPLPHQQHARSSSTAIPGESPRKRTCTAGGLCTGDDRRQGGSGFGEMGGSSLWADALCNFQMCTTRDGHRQQPPPAARPHVWGFGGAPPQHGAYTTQGVFDPSTGLPPQGGGGMPGGGDGSHRSLGLFSNPFLTGTGMPPQSMPLGQMPPQPLPPGMGGQAFDFTGTSPHGSPPHGHQAPDEADEMLVDELIKQEGEKGLWTLVTELFHQPTAGGPAQNNLGGSGSPAELPLLSPSTMGLHEPNGHVKLDAAATNGVKLEAADMNGGSSLLSSGAPPRTPTPPPPTPRSRTLRFCCMPFSIVAPHRALPSPPGPPASPLTALLPPPFLVQT
jgi:hypothetical protein